MLHPEVPKKCSTTNAAISDESDESQNELHSNISEIDVYLCLFRGKVVFFLKLVG